MGSSETATPRASGTLPFDGTPTWLEQLPIRHEQLARLLLSSAAPDGTGSAAPELLTAALQFSDAEVSLDDTIEGLLWLQDAGFVLLVTVRGAEQYLLHPDARRYIPVTNGKGAREGASAGERARERERGPTRPRPNGARSSLGSAPPRFCPEHMPHGTIEDCWACGRTRETRQAVLAERRDRLRDTYRLEEGTFDE